MTSNYWSQWDKDDLDSWQGKDYNPEESDEDDDEFEEEDPEEEEAGCRCGSYCFDCLGMSWHDFM